MQVLLCISLLRRSLWGAWCLPLGALSRRWLCLRQCTAGIVPLPLRTWVVRPSVRERRSVCGPTLSSRRNVRHRRPVTSQPRYQVRFPSSLYVPTHHVSRLFTPTHFTTVILPAVCGSPYSSTSWHQISLSCDRLASFDACPWWTHLVLLYAGSRNA